MELNEYQKKAMETCLTSSKNFVYMMSGLTAEVGEVNDKIAKAVRKGWISINDNNIAVNSDCPEDFSNSLQKEVGDCLWFIACISEITGWELEEVANANLEKLNARKAAGTIIGNGDGITDRK